jgi:hypothetical protein
MSWITLSVEDVKTRLTGAEVTALQSAALASGQSDPLPDIVSKTVKELRGRLRNLGTLEAGEMIPDSWAHHALAIIRHRLATRLPASTILTEERIAEYQDAIRSLEALGPIVPDTPTTPDTTAGTGMSSPQFAARDCLFTREDQDGW